MSIKDLITTPAAKKQIAAALPEHMTVDRQVRVALTALNKTPKLAQCTQGSFVEALMTCSELGLEPNGRHAHLVPYGDRCTLIVDYKGLIELAFRSGKVESIRADVVYSNDLFDYSTCEHLPNAWRDPEHRREERGEMIGAYCVVEMKNGARHRERMTTDEINGIKDRSRAGRSGPWVTDFHEMAKKTVFRRASKWIPQCSHLQNAFEADGDTFEPRSFDEPRPDRRGIADGIAACIESTAVENVEEPSDQGVSDDA
tara:strand:+ start:20313 stop:21083 length:771 start_codon:yes stop_codon:yes gene_type:complete